MKREFSAGGVLVHVVDGRPVLAAIRPEGKPEGLWALPKGRIGKGEKPEATAVREVEEETGARGALVRKLGDVRYVYTWKGERIFKVVSFYLLRYEAGKLGDAERRVRARGRGRAVAAARRGAAAARLHGRAPDGPQGPRGAGRRANMMRQPLGGPPCKRCTR